MGLILPRAPSWSHWTTSIGSPTGTSNLGVAVPAGDTVSYVANTDGNPVTVLSALSHDCEYMIVHVNNSRATSADSSMLMDILVDYAGGTSWTELIADLLVGFADMTQGGTPSPREYHFPIWLPAGTSIGARARCAHTALITPRVVMQVGGGNANPESWWCGQKVATVGTFTAASSVGQTHTPGISGAFSSWTSLGSTLANAAGAVQWAAQGFGSLFNGNGTYRWQFGVGSNQVGPELLQTITSTSRVGTIPRAPVFYSFPAGAQLQVRGANLSTGTTPIDVGGYVVE